MRRKKDKGTTQQAKDEEALEGDGTTQTFHSCEKAATQQEARANRDLSHRSLCTAMLRGP